MNDEMKKEIESRLEKFGLTLDDFSKKELKSMKEEIELDQAHERSECMDRHILDGWFGTMALLDRVREKRQRSKGISI